MERVQGDGRYEDILKRRRNKNIGGNRKTWNYNYASQSFVRNSEVRQKKKSLLFSIEEELEETKITNEF